MAINSKHPDYDAKANSWKIMDDTTQGEEVIKDASFAYLPATGGQVEDGALTQGPKDVGWLAYQSYKHRARFPELVKSAIDTLGGVMVKEPAVIELPARMEGLRENATRNHESLQSLLLEIYENMLQYGRFGLLADFPQLQLAGMEQDLPHIVQFAAQAITNWDDERLEEFGLDLLSMVITNETMQTRGSSGAGQFEWMQEERWRVMYLEVENPEGEMSSANPLVYKTYVEVDGVQEESVTPLYRGVPSKEIPWTFINEKNLKACPGGIPLLALARLAIATYGESADYYNTLHQIGGDTLVIIGDELTADGDVKDSTTSTRTGTGSKIHVDEGGDAKFIGIESKGLGEQCKSYQNSLDAGREQGARLLEPRKGQAESGEALRTRVESATATLAQIALTGAAGLEDILKKIAVWIGANPDEVKVTPNMDFIQQQTEPREASDMMDAKAKGLGISDESVHEWMQDRNFVTTTFEQEKERMKSDKPLPVEPTSDVPAVVKPEEAKEEE
jgi:hypothetical protein